MVNCLVTGGAGFIGSNLVERLVKNGHRVRILDNLATGRLGNLQSLLQDIEFLQGDIVDLDMVRKAVADVELIFHKAALPSVPRSIKDPLGTNEANVNGTLNVLLAARDAGVRRVIYAASSSSYGNIPELPKHEDMPASPLSPYAVSKYSGELYLKVFCQAYGLEGLSLRYFNIFGPRQVPSSQYAAVIPKFIHALLRGESPVIYGDGEQSRDFTFVDNAVEANILAATCPRADGQVVNIACGQSFTLNDLCRRLQVITGKSIAPRYESARPGDVRHSLADLSRAREILGYEPRVGFDEGLRRTVQWFAERMELSLAIPGGSF